MKITIRRKIKSHDRTIGELAAAKLADMSPLISVVGSYLV